MDLLTNIYWLSLCIFFEARNQPLEGQVAVGHVVINRVHNRDMSVKDIVQQPQQFSWYNIDQRPDIKFEELEAMEQCLKAAQIAAEQQLNGYDMEGANHYFNPSLVLPEWAGSMKYIKKIGDHDFYRG